MVSNYHTLSWIASDLSRKFQSAKIKGAYSQVRDELILEIGDTNLPLVLDCRASVNTLYLKPTQKRAKANTADVLRGSLGDVIASCEIHPSDREISFNLESGKRIVARFFGAKANVLMLDPNGTVIDAFIDARKTVGTKMKPCPAEDLELVLPVIPSDASKSISQYLKTTLPTLGAPFVEEILCRSAVRQNALLAQLRDEDRNAIAHSYTAILRELKNPRARVYYDESTAGLISPRRFSLVDLKSCRSLKERLFDDLYEAMRFFLFGSRKALVFQGELRQVVRKIEREQEKDRRAIDTIERDLVQNAREVEYRLAGTLIMGNLDKIPRGSKEFTSQQTDNSERIRLDAALTPIQNAQKYFEKAKKARVIHEQSRARLQALRQRTMVGDRLLSGLTKIGSREELKDFMNDNSDDAKLFGLDGAKGAHGQRMFREFTVEGGFQVLAGKSSANNDLLTMRFAKPNDLWFHARGSSGSHVVLRVGTGKGAPGKRAKEQAASIAAYYSKMRNAKHVPVAVTEKKYVRKPKGSAKGSVSIERETVLIVTPGLPE